MAVTNVANNKCKSFVTSRTPFTGSNLYAEYLRPDQTVYVVWSYGEHFPLYVWANGAWYENEDGYSASTKRHKSQARPSERTVLLDTNALKEVISIAVRA